MIETTENTDAQATRSDLDLPRWSVVSFDKREMSGLSYEAAAKLMAEKEAAGVHGLCIITDEAAERI